MDGATIEIEPITKSGTIDGGTWAISPADRKQTVTTSGHTDDNNYQEQRRCCIRKLDAALLRKAKPPTAAADVSAYTTQDEADAAADSARDSAIAELPR